MVAKSNNNLTPEEQLLNLIEDQKPAGPAPVSVEEVILPESKSAGNNLAKKLSSLISRASGRSNLIKMVNRLLVAIMIMLTAYVAWGFANTTTTPIRDVDDKSEGKIISVPDTVDIARVFQMMNDRDIFNLPPPKETATNTQTTTDVRAVVQNPPAPATPAKLKLSEAIKGGRIKWIGYSWQPAPPMIILMDDQAQSKDTFCLQQGDTIPIIIQLAEGKPERMEIKIRDITNSTIVLEYEGAEETITGTWEKGK